MTTYKTPGVYVEEISTLPPSVAEVATAVPAFIGYTAIGPIPDAGGKIIPVVKRINTLLEYEALFGEASPSAFTVTTTNNGTEIGTVTRNTPVPEYLLYYSLSLYFKNGGGSCYIVSVGNYTAAPNKDHFVAGLAALEREDEPTLIVLTDAVNLSAADYYTVVCQQALMQCDKLGDRFAILDVVKTGDATKTDVDYFRSNVGINSLMYGAAYYPFVQTALTYDYTEELVTIQSASSSWKKAFGTNGILVTYAGVSSDAPKAKIVAGVAADPITFSITSAKVLAISGTAGKTGTAVATAWATWKADAANNNAQGFDIVKNGDGSGTVDAAAQVALDNQSASGTLAAIKSNNTALYNQIKTTLGQQRITLPPSGAIAGIYASVDRERGVWKAPANVSLSAVIGPVVKINQADQEDLNVDATAGKSINAIRAFTGKGTLVWGARTLAGNDNEWRYVSVRRLFNMIEESTQKATSFAVFEPNDATTWLKVKAMIESYLYGLWQQGALAGASPDDAYFVNVGLGKTMTPQDVLEGRMVVEIGVAAVRPAEFIILKFTHKLQQA
jgi:phage tail sheath protein FI